MAISKDCPDLIFWRTSTGSVLTSLPHRTDLRRAHKPYIPYGVVGWRLVGDEKWHSMDELPDAWGLRSAAGSDVAFAEREDGASDKEVREAAEAAWWRLKAKRKGGKR